MQKFEVAYTDALQRTATALVDDTANEANARYMEELRLASGNPNSEGARGSLLFYLDTLDEAKNMLLPYMGKQIYIRGLPISGSGDPLTYFQATDAQKSDSTLNALFGSNPSSIIPGMAIRDEKRIDYFGALSGAATGDYIVEEQILGGLAGKFLSGLATRWLTPSNLIAVGKVPELKQTGSGTFTGTADELYDAIRASSSDVTAISTNTGIKEKNIQKVKDHVFINEHLLDRYVDYGIPAEMKRFDSSLSQGNAWLRLEQGTHTPMDIQWLKHETAERWFENKHKSGYSKAHDAAEKRWTGNPWGY